MQVTFNNGRVALTKDLIFGLCVFGETPDGVCQWLPVDSLSKEDFDLTVRLLDNNPTFPWKDELSVIQQKWIDASKENPQLASASKMKFQGSFTGTLWFDLSPEDVEKYKASGGMVREVPISHPGASRKLENN